MKDPAIVIIAYNRADSLKRLLSSIARADYSDTSDITLIISIDKGNNEDVIRAAEDFSWLHGKKTVIKREKNMGLKAHVLACSQLAVEYGSLIVLEDDLYVSRDYYDYTKEALEFVKDDGRIAGVSLYDHLFNVHVREPFEAVNDGYDNWYFQFASSWGQAYTAAQWQGFSDWMKENDNTPFPDTVPENVRTWDDRSWLKYCIRYAVETDKYFLYPRVSHSTNFSEDGGTHKSGQAADFQVPLSHRRKGGYVFSSPDDTISIYDAFFENIYLKKLLGTDKDVVIDLYGSKQVPDHGLLLSSRALPYKILSGYGRSLRPIDANIINELPGSVFRLYDLSCPAQIVKADDVDRLFYNYRAFKTKYGLQILMRRLFGK